MILQDAAREKSEVARTADAPETRCRFSPEGGHPTFPRARSALATARWLKL